MTTTNCQYLLLLLLLLFLKFIIFSLIPYNGKIIQNKLTLLKYKNVFNSFNLFLRKKIMPVLHIAKVVGI